MFLVFFFTLCTVVVNLYDINNTRHPPREVWVQESATVPLDYSLTEDKQLHAVACLSQLLPAVVTNDSPIKGKFYLLQMN